MVALYSVSTCVMMSARRRASWETAGDARFRIEANSLNLATMPALADVWNLNHFDAFPMLWLLVLRGFSAVAGAANDTGLRILGLGVGLAMLGALWLNARRLLEFSVPLRSLALVGFNPEILRSGDSMRAYGAGTLMEEFGELVNPHETPVLGVAEGWSQQ